MRDPHYFVVDLATVVGDAVNEPPIESFSRFFASRDAVLGSSVDMDLTFDSQRRAAYSSQKILSILLNGSTESPDTWGTCFVCKDWIKPGDGLQCDLCGLAKHEECKNVQGKGPAKRAREARENAHKCTGKFKVRVIGDTD